MTIYLNAKFQIDKNVIFLVCDICLLQMVSEIYSVCYFFSIQGYLKTFHVIAFDANEIKIFWYNAGMHFFYFFLGNFSAPAKT